MPTHIKPTKEELEAGIKKATEELEKPEVIEQEEAQDVKAESEESTETKQDDTRPEADAEPEKEITEPQEEVDYKKKFTESSREAQILSYKNRKVAEAIDKASQLPEPEEQELRSEYPEWDDMTSLEQRLAKDSLINKKRFSFLEGIRKEEKDIETWNGKVDTFVDDPKTLVDNPELEGKIEEFKTFAIKPSRRGVEFETLVSSFLYNVEKKAKPKSKGAMFETGTGGPNDRPKPKSDKITTEQAALLMKTNYAKYKEYLMAGKIEQPAL